MKVAIIHDYIKEYGGAERVLEVLHGIYPEATVFTTVYLPQFLGPHRKRFENWKIVTSWFQKIPYVEKLISPLRVLTPWVFENWDLRDFDLIITSSTGAYFPNLIIRKPDTVHICYCHTPPRYLYGYPTARNWTSNKLIKLIALFINHNLRQVDFVSYQRPDYIIANSIEVKRRIWKFYRREAEVIYPPASLCEALRAGPPVEIWEKGKGKRGKKRSSPFTLHPKNYYLAGGRLARAKRIDLAIEACNKLKLPLKIFGRGFADYDKYLKSIAGPTIEFLGEVTDKELTELYRGARALIFPSQMEDFGIVPVEAQSYGLPVIALNQGGVKETVIHGRTGVLFDESTVESLIKAIKFLDKLAINSENCIENAKRFDKERFIREIKKFIEGKLRLPK